MVMCRCIGCTNEIDPNRGPCLNIRKNLEEIEQAEHYCEECIMKSHNLVFKHEWKGDEKVPMTIFARIQGLKDQRWFHEAR